MEAIEASATLRFHRISQQKAKLVADMIRGRKVEDAVRVLTFTDKRGARVMLKLLKSAIANAEGKHVEDPELLQVSRVWVNKGPYLRRQMPRARGRADTLHRPTAHITIVVKEDVEAKRLAEERRAAQEAKKAKKRAAKKGQPEAAKAAAPAPETGEAPAAKKATTRKKSPKGKKDGE